MKMEKASQGSFLSHVFQGARAGLLVGLLIGAGEAFFLAHGLQRKLASSLLGPLERVAELLSSMSLAILLDGSAGLIGGTLWAILAFPVIRRKVEAKGLFTFYLSSTLALSLAALFTIHSFRGWLPHAITLSHPLGRAFIAGMALLCVVTFFIFSVILKRLNQWKRAWALLVLWVCHAIFLPLGFFLFKHPYPTKSHGETFASERPEGSPRERKPPIILITMDTTRADHLSCYGYTRETTPNIDALAQEALLFKNCISSASWTLPAHASLFTGRSPSEHGARNGYNDKPFGLAPLSKEQVTLAETLRDDGYTTAAITGGPALDSGFGLNQGFDFYDDRLSSPLRPLALFKVVSKLHPTLQVPRARSYAKEINQLVRPWLKRHYQEPFFLFINYFDPHRPYMPKAPYDTMFDGKKDGIEVNFEDILAMRSSLKEDEKRHLLSQYDGEIASLDNHIGILFEDLKSLDLYEESLIIITSDHGESFGEHNLMEHGNSLYEDQLWVPLIIKYPASMAKRGTVEQRVQSLDIMAEILTVLNLPMPKAIGALPFDGQRREVWAENFRDQSAIVLSPERFDKDLKTLYMDDFKYIWASNGEEELYSLRDDPQESRNLKEVHLERTRIMRQKMKEWMSSLNHRDGEPNPLNLDEDTEAMLRSLGYI